MTVLLSVMNLFIQKFLSKIRVVCFFLVFSACFDRAILLNIRPFSGHNHYAQAP